MKNNRVLIGKNAILEYISTNKSINKIFISDRKYDKDIKKIIDYAKKNKIIFQFVSNLIINKIAKCSNNQGIVAFTCNYKYSSLEDIINLAKNKKEDLFVIILDHIMDPHNFGAIIRIAVGVGAHGIIIPNRNSCLITPIVEKVSVGALSKISICKVSNIAQTIEKLKKNDVWIISSDINGESIYKQNITGNIGVVFGNEKKGISNIVKENSDYIVKIPMFSDFNSLNVSVACGIISYEIRRNQLNI